MWKGLWRRWGTIPALPANAFGCRQDGLTPKVAAPKVSKGRSQTFVCFHALWSRPQARNPPATMKIKPHGCALRRGVGGDRRLRLFSLPPTRARRREIPCLRKRPAMTGSHAVRSRPFGATQHSWSVKRLGGASEDAQSYWQGRFAACTFVGFSLWAGRPRNGWGVAPNPTRDAVP